MIRSLKKVIYVVNSDVEDGFDPEIEAVFDTLEGAKGYLHRFKTRSKLILTIHTLNPDYYSDHESDCYGVEVDMTDFTVANIVVNNDSGSLYDAVQKSFDSRIGQDGSIQSLMFNVMAASVEQATISAIETAKNYQSIN